MGGVSTPSAALMQAAGLRAFGCSVRTAQAPPVPTASFLLLCSVRGSTFLRLSLPPILLGVPQRLCLSFFD